MGFTRHFTGITETGRTSRRPSFVRLGLAVSLAMTLGGCTVLEKRTEAELAYEYQLSSYQIEAPEMTLLHDDWLLEPSRQSYNRLIKALPELTPDLQPARNTQPLDPSEQLVFQWLKEQLNSTKVNASSRSHYALLIWLGYDQELSQAERETKALALLKQTDSHSAFNQYLTGIIQLNSNPVAAEASLKKSSAQQYAPAQLALARLYLGQTLPGDSARLLLNENKARIQLAALLNNKTASTLNHQQATAWLATMRFYGIGGQRNTSAAYKLISAQTEVPELLYLKALMQLHGIGTESNPKDALSQLKLAAGAGSLGAANEFALTLFNSEPTDTFAAEGSQYLQQAAASGSAIAAYNLGLILFNGINQPASVNSAEVWFQAAAAQKLPEAIRATLYLKLNNPGWFPTRLETAALKQQLEQLAFQGDGWSSYALGVLLLQGQGQPASPQSGYAWLNVAVALGYQPAASLRDVAALQMSRPELNQAQKLSQSFFDQIHQVQDSK